ncbi:MAG: S-layer homology domain-containing protein, partial [Acidimicrobiia bacterium]|nr:S-layer homology domain-containing protein [Acidimicrobiia bacterium]
MTSRGNASFVMAVVFFGALAVPAFGYEGTFIDDDGSVHEGDIEAVAEARITQGCNPPVNDRFCPEDVVTRGQIAAFLTRALSLTEGDGADLFVDDDASVFERDIDRLAAARITQGCNPPANTTFCPDAVVTRGQMAAFLVRAFDYPPSTAAAFEDVSGSVFEQDIQALAARGVTRGCDPPANTRFCPDAHVTRAQMATFLVRALGLEPIDPGSGDPGWYRTPVARGLDRVVTVPAQ